MNDNALEIADLIDSTENIAPSLLWRRPISSIEIAERLSTDQAIDISQSSNNSVIFSSRSDELNESVENFKPIDAKLEQMSPVINTKEATAENFISEFTTWEINHCLNLYNSKN